MNESTASTKLGLPGSPPITESIMVSRDLMINKYVKVECMYLTYQVKNL